nr:ComEC/Rec2 family competence protein [Pseudomonadota bacterium]
HSLKKSENSTIKKTRNNLTDFIRKHINGQAGEIAIAVTTGFRNGISNEVRQDFANSGLSHILAISGLHISLVAGLIFLVFRRILACIPPITRRFNTKKIACFLSIPAIYYYVALSGYGYPAIRSFYMTSLIFISVILDRQPLSIRSIAIAAFLILLVFPESATSVSFELSFAAVLGLIAFYEKPWWNLKLWSLKKKPFAKYFVYIIGVMTTTLIATLSTTPISLYYFNQYTLNAVFANMLAIPLTGLFIMPLATLCVLSYFTIDYKLLFDLWGYSVDILIYIAHTVGNWPGSNLKIAQPSVTYAILFGFGFLWVCLFTTRIRHIGYIFIISAFMTLFDKSHIPDIYMAGDGSVIAYLKDEQFYISPVKGTKGSFFYNQWRQEQGFLDHKIFGIEQPFKEITLIFNPWEIDKNILKNIDCPSKILTNGYLKKCYDKSIYIVDRSHLKKDGTHFIWLDPFKVKTIKQSLGIRPWVI